MPSSICGINHDGIKSVYTHVREFPMLRLFFHILMSGPIFSAEENLTVEMKSYSGHTCELRPTEQINMADNSVIITDTDTVVKYIPGGEARESIAF